MTEMSDLLTRTFVVGSTRIAVNCSTAAGRDFVHNLFQDLAVSDLPPVRTISFAEQASGQIAVEVEGATTHAQDPNAALTSLVTAFNRMALDEEPNRLHLHAAAISRNGRGVLISAPSGTGKTTLTVGLLERGWSYTSDEAVAIDPVDLVCHGFPKPLMIKAGSTSLFPRLASARATLDAGTDGTWHVPASAVAQSITECVEASAFVILQRPEGGSYDSLAESVRLHPADTVVYLLQETMDPERFGPDTIAVLARMTSRAICAAVRAGKLESTIEAIEEVGESEPALHAVRDYPGGTGVEPWSVPPGVRSVLIGDRFVVHDTQGNGTVVALDEAGSAIWRALHGDPADWWQPAYLINDTTVEFLRQLSSYGLVTDMRQEGQAS
jgi:hypothetical protein